MASQKTLNSADLLPTRQQLEAFLRSRGVKPERLKEMSSWEQVQLTREYQQVMRMGQPSLSH